MDFKSFIAVASVLHVCYCDVDLFANLISTSLGGINLDAIFSSANTLSSTTEKKIINTLTPGLHIPEYDLNFTQLVQLQNYPVEEHTVITDDGYILTIFRIPGNGPPVLLQHGLNNCADDLVTGGVDGGLPYLVSNEGYDVWLGSTRGNKYGLNHKTLTTGDREFWDNSWDEIGRYDLPAIVDYILEETGHDQLTYAGHSQGTTSFLIFLSMRPEYNDKIKLGVLLSTIAYMYHQENPFLKALAPVIVAAYPELGNLGLYYVPPNSTVLETLKDAFCTFNTLTELACSTVFFLGYGFDPSQLNWPRLAVQYSHSPTVASIKQTVHYGQLVLVNRFQRFDYGVPTNMEKYGSPFPPEYPLERISAPIAMFHSYGDLLSGIVDVNQVKNRIQNVADFYVVPHPPFNHQDYLWAKDIKTLIFPRLSQLFKKYN